MGIARKVKWNAEEIKRDSLSDATRNTLGSTLTVFQVPDFAVNELVQGKSLSQMSCRKYLFQVERMRSFLILCVTWK